MGFHTRDLRDGVRWLLATVAFHRCDLAASSGAPDLPEERVPFVALSVDANLTKPFQRNVSVLCMTNMKNQPKLT